MCDPDRGSSFDRCDESRVWSVDGRGWTGVLRALRGSGESMGYSGRFERDAPHRESRDDLIEQLAFAHGLDVRVARELFAGAERAAADDPRGQSIVHWFRRLAGLSLEAEPPAPGRRTAVRAAYGAHGAPGAIGIGRASVGPGKRTRTMRLAAEIDRRARLADQRSSTEGAAQALGAAGALLEPLDAATRSLIERTTGESLGDVQVRRNDRDLAARGVLGEAHGNVIRLSPAVGGPDDWLGRRVRLHEAAHILQFRKARGESADPDGLDRLSDPEFEAEAVAHAAATGRHRRVRVAADSSRAHAFPGEGLLDAGASLVSGGIDVLKDPMGFLREKAPELVGIMGDGLERLVEKVGHGLADAVSGLLRGLGLDGLAHAFDSLVAAVSPGSNAFGILTGCCECLDRFLDSMLGGLNRMLASPTAQKVQSTVASAQANHSDGTIGMLADFFGLLKKFGGPVMGIVDGAGKAIERVKSVVGPLADRLWKFIAGKLGLDAGLSPIEAIKAKMQQIWAKAASALAPLKNALGELWQVVKDVTPLGQLIKFFGDLRTLVAAVKKLATTKAKDSKTWLATARDLLKGTVFEPLIAALQTGNATFDAVSNTVGNWLRSLFAKLGLLDAWKSSIGFLNQLADGIRGVIGSIKGMFQALADKLRQLMASLAKAAQDLIAEIRPLLDFVSGLIIALVATASGNILAIPLFLAGNLWQHVLSDCYKQHIIDFLLDAFIALVEWIPVSGDASLVLPVLRAGALGFLRRMKQVDMAKKIEAANMVASLFAGNLEFAVGLFVGILKGIYESTIGTVVFVFEAALWLAQAGAWALGLAESPLSDLLGGKEGEAGQEGDSKDEETDDVEEEGEVEADDEEVVDDAPEEDSEPEHEGDEVEEGGDQEQDPLATEPGAGASDAASGADSDRLDVPPAVPADLLNGRALFEAIFKTGVTRQELEEIFRGLSTSAQQAAGKAGAKAADELIAYLTRKGTPYEIGEAVGTVLGIVATEVVIIVLTAGAGSGKTALTSIKLLTKAVDSLPKLAKALKEVHASLAPIFKFFKSLKKGIGEWANRIASYIDDLLEWANKSLHKLLGKERPPGSSGGPRDARNPHDARDPHDRKDGDPRDPKKPDDPKQPRRPSKEPDLKLHAVQAARKGWAEIESALAGAVHTPATVRATLARVRVLKPRRVRIQLSVRRRRSGWKVKARASKGARWATARAGSGWVSRDEQNRAWLATTSNAQLHKELLREHVALLERETTGEAGQDARGQYASTKELARRLVSQGEVRIHARLRGIDYRIEVEPFSAAERDSMIDTELLITPNKARNEAHTPLSAEDWRKRAHDELKRFDKQLREVITKLEEEHELDECRKVSDLLAYVWRFEGVCDDNARKPHRDLDERYNAAAARSNDAATFRRIYEEAKGWRERLPTLRDKLPEPPWDTKYAEPRSGDLALKSTKLKIRETFYPAWDKDGKTLTQPTTQRNPDPNYQSVAEMFGTPTNPKGIEVKKIGDKYYWKYTGRRYGFEPTLQLPAGDPEAKQWWLFEPSNYHNSENPSRDHSLISVANHWNTVGRFTDQAARERFFLNQDNLDVVPICVNSHLRHSRKEPNYIRMVGVNFRGPGRRGP
jgi:hypothetical protein